MSLFLKIRPLKEQEFWSGNDEFSFVLTKFKVYIGHQVGYWPRIVSVLALEVLCPRKPSVLSRPGQLNNMAIAS